MTHPIDAILSLARLRRRARLERVILGRGDGRAERRRDHETRARVAHGPAELLEARARVARLLGGAR